MEVHSECGIPLVGVQGLIRIQVKLGFRERAPNWREDLLQQVGKPAVRHGRMDESEGRTGSSRSDEQVSLDANRDDHQLLGGVTENPGKHSTQITANDKKTICTRY